MNERKTPKSRGNFRVPECMKFDCAARTDESCAGCIRFSNYKKEVSRLPRPDGEQGEVSSLSVEADVGAGGSEN